MSRLNQLLTLARSLPPTPMRVAGSPQLSDAIEAIANRSFPTQPSTSASTSALPPSGSPAAVTQAGDSNTTGPVGSQPSTPEVTLGPGEERAIDGMIQVIQRLKSDQHARQYPLSNRLLRPAQDPVYYKRLVDGVYLAKQGKKRSFWKRFFQVRGEA